ncbi:unnamed protein product [Tenebrio molitor]|nr:unnamed protein product [Tenebrio molitor]
MINTSQILAWNNNFQPVLRFTNSIIFSSQTQQILTIFRRCSG